MQSDGSDLKKIIIGRESHSPFFDQPSHADTMMHGSSRKSTTHFCKVALLVAGAFLLFYGVYLYQDLNQRLRDSNHQADKFKQKYEESSAQLQVLYEQKDRLQGSLKAEQARSKDLKERSDKFKESMVQSHLDETAKVKRQLADASARHESAKRQHEYMRDQYSKLQEEHRVAKEDHQREVQKQSSDFLKARQQLEEQNQALQAKVSHLEKQNSALSLRMAGMQKKENQYAQILEEQRKQQRFDREFHGHGEAGAQKSRDNMPGHVRQGKQEVPVEHPNEIPRVPAVKPDLGEQRAGLAHKPAIAAANIAKTVTSNSRYDFPNVPPQQHGALGVQDIEFAHRSAQRQPGAKPLQMADNKNQQPPVPSSRMHPAEQGHLEHELSPGISQSPGGVPLDRIHRMQAVPPRKMPGLGELGEAKPDSAQVVGAGAGADQGRLYGLLMGKAGAAQAQQSPNVVAQVQDLGERNQVQPPRRVKLPDRDQADIGNNEADAGMGMGQVQVPDNAHAAEDSRAGPGVEARSEEGQAGLGEHQNIPRQVAAPLPPAGRHLANKVKRKALRRDLGRLTDEK